MAFTLLARVRADAPAPPPTATPPAAPFQITLNVSKPAGSDEFDFNHPNSSFDVTIKNVSAAPQAVRQDGSSWGYDNVYVRFIALDGKTLARPIGIGRFCRGWAGNVARPQTLKPGDETVRRLLISEVVQVYYLPAAHHKVTAVAVLDTLGGCNFNSRAGNAKYGVWSGQAVSTPVTFNALLPTFPTPIVR